MAKSSTVLLLLAILGIQCSSLAAVPEPYYINETWDDHSLHGLKKLLGGEFTVAYQPGVFDCGEMSAYLEWLLQNHGFEAGFCMDGTGPWLIPAGAGYNRHMWVTAELHNDTTGEYTGRVYIESTSNPIGIITYFDPRRTDYDRPQQDTALGMKQYLSIYDALDGITPTTGDSNSVKLPESELDWWIFGHDLLKDTVPYRKITAADFTNLRNRVAGDKSELGTFRTV